MQNARRSLSLWTLAALGGLAAAPLARAQVTLETQVVGPRMARDPAHIISPAGVRTGVAVGTEDGRGAMVVDGVQEAPFDSLVNFSLVVVSIDHQLNDTVALAERVGRRPGNPDPLLFSPDGSRYAYVVVRGDAFEVVVDGRVLWKNPVAGGDVSGLEFSPLSRHVYHTRHGQRGNREDGFQIVMDGEPGPVSYLQPLPVFSPDDQHYAYVATDLDRTTHRLIVDGKEADYLGYKPKWTAANQLVTVTPTDPETQRVSVLLDGRQLIEVPVVERVLPDPVGKRLAIVTRGNSRPQLYVDAEEVLAAREVVEVVWSADGKRYAAVCRSVERGTFVALDGKPGPLYDNITHVAFSPDGSQLHFVGYHNGTYSLVIDNSLQSPGVAMPIEPLPFGPGADLAYVSGVNLHQMSVVLGDRQLGPLRQVEHLTLAPDGERYAVAYGGENNSSALIDGMIYEDVNVVPFGALGLAEKKAERFVFSPDSKHLLQLGWFRNNPRAMGVFVDDTLIPTRTTKIFRPQFTPDSRHVVWVERSNPHDDIVVDGQVVAQFDLTGSSFWEAHSDVSAMSADGVFTILGPQGDSIVRLRITPDPERGIDVMLREANGG